MKTLMVVAILVAMVSCSKHTLVTQPTLRDSDNAVAEQGVVPDPVGQRDLSGAAEYRSRAYESVYFDFDKSDMRSDLDMLRATDTATDIIRTGRAVRVEGHCDERGTQMYNIALGERRALNVARYLRAIGVDPGKISCLSYGKERPADAGHDELAWAKNRRAEFKPKE